jgi:MFS transporter, Spinster family, sphingosine-1-phosphate transporter
MKKDAETYKRYLLLVLMVGLTFTYLDRQVIGLATQQLKDDLHLTDSELGFLTGFAFALFYSLLGFPIARLADRGNRVTLLAMTTALCGLAMAMCGLAANFFQLLLIRIGVAIGETGFIPTANSLIASYFDRTRRAKALATYFLGSSLSVVIGYLLGGWLLQSYGWRKTFAIMGAPGIAVAAVMGLVLREPRRASFRSIPPTQPTVTIPKEPSAQPHVSLREALRVILRIPTYRQLLYSNSVSAFFDFGRFLWLPAFYMRSFHLDARTVGMMFAVVFGGFGLIGCYLGGWLITRYIANDERLQLRCVAGMFVLNTVLAVWSCWTLSSALSFAISAIGSVVSAMTAPPTFSILQSLIPERLRAQGTAFLLLASSLIGMGLGPWLAGVLSDLLHASLGEESLRYTLVVLSFGFLWCAWHTWRGGDTVAQDLAGAAAQESSAALALRIKMPTKTPVVPSRSSNQC